MSQPDLFLKATLFAAAFDNHEILGDDNPPDLVGEFFRKAELGLLGEGKTPRVNPAVERFRREVAIIDGRFAKMYQDIAKSESDEAAEIFGRKSGGRLAKGSPLRLFIPICKVDSEQKLVYGVAASEVPDRQNEILDYESSKPFFQAWSESVRKDSQGASLGNVREMHQLSAVGVLSQIQFNDAAKQIEVCVKVTDDSAWQKVLSRTYCGFSIGGRYEKTWPDGKLTRYIGNPSEISLVDRPAIPDATFQLVKADGSVKEILRLVNA
jgi:hypothetical protein